MNSVDVAGILFELLDYVVQSLLPHVDVDVQDQPVLADVEVDDLAQDRCWQLLDVDLDLVEHLEPDDVDALLQPCSWCWCIRPRLTLAMSDVLLKVVEVVLVDDEVGMAAVARFGG